MRIRSLIRAAMVLVAIAVVTVVAISWEGRPELPVEEPVDGDTPPEEREIVSSTTGLRHVANVNGCDTYEVFAAEAVSSSGNRVEYRGGVELVLYQDPCGDDGDAEQGPDARQAGEERPATRVRGERMTLVERPIPIEGDAYEEIRVMDDVRALLPGGVEVLSEVLTYRNGDLRTDAGVRLYTGDLVIESRRVSYDHETQAGALSGAHPDPRRPELPGPVRLWSEVRGQDEVAGAFDVQGSSGTMDFDLGLAELTLRNRPALLLEEAQLTAFEIVLGLDEEAGAVEAIRAQTDARATWLAATAPGDHVVAGQLISVDMQDGRAEGLQVTRGEDPEALRPRFELGESGLLRADRFALGFGEGASVEALGEAYFFPREGDTRLEHIRAENLTMAAGELEQLAADGDVEVLMVGDGEPISFHGPRAVLVYAEGDIASAEWPAGLRHQGADGREVSAGHGALEADTGNWILDGDPAPRFLSRDIDVEAGKIVLLADGGLDLLDRVAAQLRGDLVRTVGPLFGGAAQIEASADELQVRDEDRLTFRGNANVWQGEGDYRMRADEIRVRAAIDELQAEGNVFVTLQDPGDETEGGTAEEADESQTVVLTGHQLLVEGTPSLALAMAGDALLELSGGARTIGGSRLEVAFLEDGAWDSVEVFGNVVMRDSAGTGEGDRLEYDAETKLVVIYAGESTQATFVNDQGLDIRDREGLRLLYEDGNLRITAMQNGTTQTIRGGQ